jgi:hypothetical protein
MLDVCDARAVAKDALRFSAMNEVRVCLVARCVGGEAVSRSVRSVVVCRM